MTSSDTSAARANAVRDELLARPGEILVQARLDPTRRVLDLLGRPDTAFPFVHVTGTNGKTSTSRMIESLLRAYGLRTGLFVSPHLEVLDERIVIDGRPIEPDALVRNWDDIHPYVTMVDDELRADGQEILTFFEVMTVLAFACFADAPVDVGVIEVGMGGEWDSTNVADGQVAVFAPISLDHQAVLGNTIEEIAATKAGIIKPGAVVVSAVQDPAAAVEIEKAALIAESRLLVEDDAFAVEASVPGVGGQVVSVRGVAGRYEDLFLALIGDHQAHNAALAIAATEAFIGDGSQAIPDDVVAQGLREATSPGRMQLVGVEPPVIVDAAHNPAGAATLAVSITDYYDFDRVIGVIGVLRDKDAAGIVTALAGVVDEFVITRSSSPRAFDAEELAVIAEGIVGAARVRVEPDLESGLIAARERAASVEKGAVVVSGSITVIGEAVGIARREGWKP